MAKRCIEPAKGPLDADLAATASKSATHRAVVAAALARGRSEIREPLDADDTRRTLEGVRALGVVVEERERTWIVHGAGTEIPGAGVIELGASGTSARFLVALAALGRKPSRLDGSPRLRARPMDELLEALTALGASVRGSGGSTPFPLEVGGSPVRGGSATLSGARSSQFASALMLAAPAFARGLKLTIAPPRVSFGYVRMTAETITSFGGHVAFDGEAVVTIPRRQLGSATIVIEADYSSASYPMAAVAILGGRLRLRGLRAGSVQPDARFLRDLATLGVHIDADADGIVVEASGRVPAFSWDLADAPDLAPTAAVLAAFADGPCSLSGLGHLALKESDRVAVLTENLAKLGVRASADHGTLTIVPPPRRTLRGAEIAVADDHRIAMAFAVAGLAVPGVSIDAPSAVAKSYPGFWDDLAALARTGS